MFICFFFFFSSRRRHTRLQGDWSSDVCSSDLRRCWRRPGTARQPSPTSGGRSARLQGRARRRRQTSTKQRCGDRKSTRLNSSHLVISYAVFCLKKKKTRPKAADKRYLAYDHTV